MILQYTLSYLNVPDTRTMIKKGWNFSNFLHVVNIPNVYTMIIINTRQLNNTKGNIFSVNSTKEQCSYTKTRKLPLFHNDLKLWLWYLDSLHCQPLSRDGWKRKYGNKIDFGLMISNAAVILLNVIVFYCRTSIQRKIKWRGRLRLFFVFTVLLNCKNVTFLKDYVKTTIIFTINMELYLQFPIIHTYILLIFYFASFLK